jgi:hypothetical protein
VPQIEYGDFYKFVVSLGDRAGLAAILAPRLFLREPFDLMIEASRLSQLTPAAQQIVLLRQTYLLRLLPVIPWFSFSLLMMGTSAIGVGLKKWYNRQSYPTERSGASGFARPIEQFVAAYEIQDASGVNLSFERGRKAVLNEPKLRRSVSIGAN